MDIQNCEKHYFNYLAKSFGDKHVLNLKTTMKVFWKDIDIRNYCLQYINLIWRHKKSWRSEATRKVWTFRWTATFLIPWPHLYPLFLAKIPPFPLQTFDTRSYRIIAFHTLHAEQNKAKFIVLNIGRKWEMEALRNALRCYWHVRKSRWPSTRLVCR